MVNAEHLGILKQGVKVWSKWRKEHPGMVPDLNGADLTGEDLNGANLNGANLTGANLTQANLTETNLYSTNFSRAKLNRADLTGANLCRANLYRTDLTGANLCRAHLYGAYLYQTHLYGVGLADADLSHSVLAKTEFLAVDLGSVIGLELVIHRGPSHIDTQTFQLSQGKIPEIFLRGAGLSDEMISFFRTLYGKPVPSEYYSCFISYSHKDKAFARRLHDKLQERGIRCWLDDHQILPGDDLYDQINRGIRIWDKTLLCCSEHSLTSSWVDNEIKIALGKEQELMEQRGKRVLALIPLNLDGYLFKWKRGMAQEIKSRMAPDFKGWEHDNSVFEEQLERVMKALMTEDAGREAPPTPRL